MLKKVAEWFKNLFSYPPELKEIQQRALETNRIYESALKKAKPALKKATTRTEKAMPLRKGTSDTTRNKNIAKEVKAGKSVKQAVAIGYAVQKEAIAKKGGKAAAKKAKTK